MLSLIISVAAALLVFGFTQDQVGSGGAIGCGLVVFIIVWGGIFWSLRKKINAINQKIQQVMTEAQGKINRMMQQFQRRPNGNVKLMQQQLEKEQFAAIRQALAITDEMERFYKWNLLMKRQNATIKMMFYYQLKEFDKVDEFAKTALFFDARSIAMHLARLFKRNEIEKLDKFYKSKCRRLKNDDCALAVSTYAWIMLKLNQPEKAFNALNAAKKRSNNPVVLQNYEALANKKIKNFSNANLGDSWYALYLEEPKIRQQRIVQQQYR
ncbi:MAG: DUF3021 domain-containing protein [Lentisphaeria bacterium]|nr:DUF3021 domain-containing protein [Lentisphaeria bacterium]